MDEYCVTGGTVWMSMVFLCCRRDSVDEYCVTGGTVWMSVVLQEGQCG